eukprot:3444198-Rhodomonas_salina.1
MAGVGFHHANCFARAAACFADNLALITGSVKDMNKLLAKVRKFADWAGMDMCTHKCEVACFDFSTNQEIPTRELKKVLYGNHPLPRLPAAEAVRYLSLCLNIQGNTSCE